jgi:nucleoside-diphosphate-sugar epimerase
MRVLVCGATGCIGGAVASALRSRGHVVVAAGRGMTDGPRSLRLDFMERTAPLRWAERLCALRLDAVVNCVGILVESRSARYTRVHARGPAELFEGAALAGLGVVVQVSALGVGDDAEALELPYLRTKLEADDALAALGRAHAGLRWHVLRPSLVYGPRSASGALFATLASLPVIALPGRGAQRLQPLHVYELAEAIARLVERRGERSGVLELGGPEAVTYRQLLETHRRALGLGPALWLPLPHVAMRLGARAAEVLPQRAFSRTTIRLLERGSVARINALAALLGRAPTALDRGLAITPSQPHVDLTARFAPAPDALLRAALAFMWLYTAAVSAALPHESGVLALLARCGFEGAAGLAMLVASCALNIALGVLTLVRPSPGLFAVQAGAIVGYTVAAALAMPALTIDHCAPLAKNLPLLALVIVLACAPRRTIVRGGRDGSTRRATRRDAAAMYAPLPAVAPMPRR